jgi:hypothetical protein
LIQLSQSFLQKIVRETLIDYLTIKKEIMKQYSLLNLFAFITLLFISGCKKESSSTPTAPPPPPLRTIILDANAGPDDSIFLPTNYCMLSGGVNYNGNDTLSVVWSKISGPTSFHIEEPNSLRTKVSNLISGIYRFELTVSANNLTDKDTCTVTVGASPPPPPPPTSNIPPVVRAGTDKLVYYPTNFTNLYGSMMTWGNIIQTISWKKVSGPSSFFIETPNSLGTKVSNLQVGVYQFEVSVQDTAGLSDKDTCTVIVGQISNNPSEIIFQNQIWGNQGAYSTLLWGSSIIITNIYQYLAAGSVFRVYIKRDNSINWEELPMSDPNAWYSFSLIDGNLHIYSYHDNESDTPDIKLIY